MKASDLLKETKKNRSLSSDQHYGLAEASLEIQFESVRWAMDNQRWRSAVHDLLNAVKAVREPAQLELWRKPELNALLRRSAEPVLVWAVSADFLSVTCRQFLHEVCGFLREHMVANDPVRVAADRLWPHLSPWEIKLPRDVITKIAQLECLAMAERQKRKPAILEAIRRATRDHARGSKEDPEGKALVHFARVHYGLLYLHHICGDWRKVIEQAEFLRISVGDERNWSRLTRLGIARALFLKGQAFQTLRDLREAAAAYEESYKLRWHPETAKSYARCALFLGFPENAARILNADPPPDVPLTVSGELAIWTVDSANEDGEFRDALIGFLRRHPKNGHIASLLSTRLDSNHEDVRAALASILPELIQSACSDRVRALAFVACELDYRDRFMPSDVASALRVIIATVAPERRLSVLALLLIVLCHRAIFDETYAYVEEAAQALEEGREARLRELLVGEKWFQQHPRGYLQMDRVSLARRLDGPFRAWLSDRLWLDGPRLNIEVTTGICFLRASSWLEIRRKLRALFRQQGPLAELYGECDAKHRATLRWHVHAAALRIEILPPPDRPLSSARVQSIESKLAEWRKTIPDKVNVSFYCANDIQLQISLAGFSSRPAIAEFLEDKLLGACKGTGLKRDEFEQKLEEFFSCTAEEEKTERQIELFQFALDFTAMRARLWLVEEGNDDETLLHPRNLLHHFKEEESLELPSDPRLWVDLMRRFRRYRPDSAAVIELAEHTGKFCEKIGGEPELEFRVLHEDVFPVRIAPEMFNLVLSALVANARNAQRRTAKKNKPIVISLGFDTVHANTKFLIENHYEGPPTTGGSRLGLKAVERTLAMHGGTGPIDYRDSNKQIYSTHFTLPLAYSDIDVDESEAESAS